MSLEEQIKSKSCKERANAINTLEEAWLNDKNSYSHLLSVLLKEKNVVVLEQLIPALKVIPFTREIATFVIENLKTLKLKPKIFDYLDCKHKQLDLQLLFDQILQKNPKFVENVLFYLIHYYEKVSSIANEAQIDQLRMSLQNSDPNVRKRAIELMRIFYFRNNSINLDGLKPILIKEIKEKELENRTPQKRTVEIKPTENSTREFNTQEFAAPQSSHLEDRPVYDFPSSAQSASDGHEISDEQKNRICNGLEDSNWKTRLNAINQIAHMRRGVQVFTDALNKRLKDANNQIFTVALNILKENKLSFDRETLIQKLVDKKLQQKIKEANLIVVCRDDFSGKKTPEVYKMLVQIAIQQGNKSLKDVISSLESSARKDVRETVKEYLDFVDNKKTNKKYTSQSTSTSPDRPKVAPEKTISREMKKVNPQNGRVTPPKSLEVSKTAKISAKKKITKARVENFSDSEPYGRNEQREIISYFQGKYDLFLEKDFKKRLEKMEMVTQELINEPDLVKFVYSVKERNKMMNMKYLELFTKLKSIDTLALCHIIVKIFTDLQIFTIFANLSKKLDEKILILFFLKFIKKNKKGKLFEKGVEALTVALNEFTVDQDVLEPQKYVGKEKQAIIDLNKRFLQPKEEKPKEIEPETPKNIQPPQDLKIETEEESLIQKFETSIILDDNVDENEEAKTPEPKDSTPIDRNYDRPKDGKSQEKYFNEPIQLLFQNYKIEASDFIIQYIYEQKMCLCGQKKGLECCIHDLIVYYSNNKYVLSSFEAEKFVKLISKEETFQMLEKVYPKSKIAILRQKENSFSSFLGKAFRAREYNMSPFRKKHKSVTEKSQKRNNLIFPLHAPKSSNVEKFIVEGTFHDSFNCLNDFPFHTAENSTTARTQNLNFLTDETKLNQKRPSTNTINNFFISDLHKKNISAFDTLLRRAKDDISSLFYISNSLINALIVGFDIERTIEILLILSTNSEFLKEIEFETMKSLHLQIIKNKEGKRGDILINLCLNAPVPILLQVYLDILNENKEIILKLIWRNSRREFLDSSYEILKIFEEFFNKNYELDDLTFKILQLHISKIVSSKKLNVSDYELNGQVKEIITNMLEKLRQKV